MAFGNYSGKSSTNRPKQYEDVKVTAKNQISIGDTVYTIQNGNTQFSLPLSSTVNTLAFSPDGKLLVLGGKFIGYVNLYSVSGTTITYLSQIYAKNGNVAFTSSITSAKFSPDGNALVIGGNFTGSAKIYTVTGTTVTFISDIYANNNNATINGTTNVITFSPDGTKLIIGGIITGYAKVYTVSGTTVTYVSDIYADNSGTALNSTVYSVAFNSDGTKLAISGNFTGRAKIYLVSGTTVTYISDIYADSGTTAISSYAFTIAFSPDGTKLVLGGLFTGYAKLYSVSGTTITYISDIKANNSGTALSTSVSVMTFSPDGTKLVLGGGFAGYAKLYTVAESSLLYILDIPNNTGIVSDVKFNPTGNIIVLTSSTSNQYAKSYIITDLNITFNSYIYANASDMIIDSNVSAAVFSPDGTKLVLGGGFTGYAKIYSVSGNILTFISNIYSDNNNTILSSYINAVAFSPDGTKLVLGGAFNTKAKFYTVSGTTVTYVSDIYANNGTSILSSYVNSITFSSDGNALVLGGAFTGKAKIYSVSGTTVTYVSDVKANNSNTSLTDAVYTTVFSPTSNVLILGGVFSGIAKIYTVSGTTVTYVSDIYADNSGTALTIMTYIAAFSPDGTKLVLGGGFPGKSKIYSISGTTITYISNLYADNSGVTLTGTVYTIAFSPDGTKLLIGGGSGLSKLYTFNNSSIVYITDLYANTINNILSNNVYTAAFSPDGTKLILGGLFYGYVQIYLPSREIIYASNIYSDSGTTALSTTVFTAAFSPDGKLLILGGQFTGYAKLYSVSGTTITYVSDIYADGGTMALSAIVQSLAFSPDGTKLVIGGQFPGYAKIYSVSGTTVTFVSNIYADSGTTALQNYVFTISFSPDGTKLILGGYFTGSAKIYTVTGTTVTFISNIYDNDSGASLSGDVFSTAFSPDGTKLLIGGSFINKARIYSVSGTTVTFVSGIYADNSGTALPYDVNSVAFSPDGNALVLGGNFIGRAKIYSIVDTTVTYVSDIYSDGSDTALSSYVFNVAFSPDGTKLTVCGQFTGYAKIYNVSGTTVTYISDIYASYNSNVLSNSVKCAIFNNTGYTIVVVGLFSGYAKIYNIWTIPRFYAKYDMHTEGRSSTKIPNYAVSVGYSKQNIDNNTEGTVRLLGNLTN